MISCWLLAGGGAGADVPGHLGWGVADAGWQPVADMAVRQIGPVLEACGSPRRIVLHNPWGLWNTPGRPAQMSLHQERYAEACDDLDLAVASFQPAWLPLIRSGWEVVAYLGFDELVDAPKPAKPSTWFNHLHRSLNRTLATGCSVGIDTAAAKSAGDGYYTEPRVARLLQSLGVRVYVEGPPKQEWTDTPIIIDASASDSWRGLPNRDAETVVRVDPGKLLLEQIEQAGEIVARGYTAAIDAVTLLDHAEVVVKRFGIAQKADNA